MAAVAAAVVVAHLCGSMYKEYSNIRFINSKYCPNREINSL